MFLTIFLLALVLVPKIGTRLFGARRMFTIGMVQVRPAALAKITIVLYLAFWLARRRQESGALLPMVPVMVVIGLIWLEPDVGTCHLMGLVVLVLLLIGGVRWRIVGALSAAWVGLFLWRIWLNPIAWARFGEFFSGKPLHDGMPHSLSYCELALSRGGWTGIGLANSKLSHSPPLSASSDFIGAFIGEAFGWGGWCVMLAFATFIVAGFSVSVRACNRFGFLLGAGIVSLIGLQALLHLAVTTGSFPSKSVSLPFVSYGGAEVCVLLTGLGVLLNITRQAQPTTTRGRIPG